MSVILVGPDFAGGEEFARRAATELGYRYSDDAVILERAAAWGAPEQQLRRALSEPSGFLERFTHSRRIHLTVLQSALIEELRDGKTLYYGKAGYLFPSAGGHVLRLRLAVGAKCRLRWLKERLKFDSADAVSYMEKADRERSRWLASLYGIAATDSADDPTICLDEIRGANRALSAIVAAAKGCESSESGTTPDDALASLALGGRVKAQLALDPATSHLELGVEACGTYVLVRGMVSDERELGEVQRVALSASGVERVSVGTIAVRSPSFFGLLLSDKARAGSGRPVRSPAFRWATAAIAALFCLALGISILVKTHPSGFASRLLLTNGQTRSFEGVITDTRCVRDARNGVINHTAECVRACVKSDRGVQYALYDGRQMYVLSDQRGAEAFAAAHVRVTGVVREGTNILRVRTINR